MAAPQETVKMAGFGYTTDLLNRTVNLATGITAADVGKAVTLDTSGANKFKLAGDNDRIYGRLEVVEKRDNEGTLVGNVKLHLMGVKLPVKSGETVAVGDVVCGAGDGEIKKQGTSPTFASNHYVVEVGTDYAVVYSAN